VLFTLDLYRVVGNPSELGGELSVARLILLLLLFMLDLYRVVGNPQSEAESYRLHDSFSQMLLKDHFQSTQLSEHRLIEVWKDEGWGGFVDLTGWGGSEECVLRMQTGDPPEYYKSLHTL